MEQINLEDYERKIVNFNELQKDDLLNGTDGYTQVLKVYEEHVPRRMFRLEFDNGKTIDASDNHLWYVETDLDRALHSKRIKTGKKIFKHTSDATIEDLINIANQDEVVETRLIDFLDLFGAANGRGEIAAAIIRVAESIGHIVEEKSTLKDMSTGETRPGTTVRIYDARLFAQQVLALHNRKFRKKWPLIVGRVITTEQLSYLSLTVDIPEISDKMPFKK